MTVEEGTRRHGPPGQVTQDWLTTLDDVKRELDKDPAFRAEHERQQPYHDTVVALAKLRAQHGWRWPIVLVKAIWETR